MQEFTISDFQELNENEKSLSKILHSKDDMEITNLPTESTINNILAYSKALSVRKSDRLGHIEHLLN